MASLPREVQKEDAMTNDVELPWVGLDEESIMAEAREKAGLSDFGDASFHEPMRRLLRTMEEEARLNAIGRIIQRDRVVGLLVNRLRTEEYIKQYPEMLQKDIRAPLVIVGLGRTGTTMLQRLIASDPRIYSVLWWESRNPAPFPSTRLGSGERDPRIVDAEAEVNQMIEGAPNLAAMHPIEAEAPDEEIMMLEHSFFSTTPEALVNIPSFSAWLEQQDQTAGYEYLKRLLQFLQWQKMQSGITGERWVLKSPHHLGFLDLVLKVFPDATVLMTHRDPLETVPSWASLIYALRQIYSDQAEPKEVGRQWGDKMNRVMKQAMKVRDASSGRFVDIWYLDVLRDPLKEVRRIYDLVGLEFTVEAEKCMRQWTIDHARDKRPVHHYTLEEFGYTKEGIERDFAEYRERFVLGRQ